MREILGMPQGVAGAHLTFPGIFSVIFRYDDFPVTYESGLNSVPLFDAHIEVYSQDKIVRVDYDTPFCQGTARDNDHQREDWRVWVPGTKDQKDV